MAQLNEHREVALGQTVFRADEVDAMRGRSGAALPELMLGLLHDARALARPETSGFAVGAVALGRSGGLYIGANAEFPGAALSLAIHAEQSAVVNAWHHGEEAVDALAVTAAPCGYCRQFLWELAGAETLTVHLAGHPAYPLSPGLLPDPFGPADLGVGAALLAQGRHGLRLRTSSEDPLVLAALDAADRSYAPYTTGYAGVALALSDGGLHSGRLAENAAYSPSMTPIAGAVAMQLLGGSREANPVRIVLVETAAARVSQRGLTDLIGASLGCGPCELWTATVG